MNQRLNEKAKLESRENGVLNLYDLNVGKDCSNNTQKTQTLDKGS